MEILKHSTETQTDELIPVEETVEALKNVPIQARIEAIKLIGIKVIELQELALQSIKIEKQLRKTHRSNQVNSL